MDIKIQQDMAFYESEQQDKKRKEEFYKTAFTVIEEDPLPLTKEELRKVRMQYFEKKIDLNKPS